jgi:hypothetical protein
MSPDEKRRQQARRRLAARREQKRRALQRAASPRPPTLLRSAATWPVAECLVSREWQQAGELVQVVVARRSAAGAVAAAVFLVDLACLGVKDAFARVFTSPGEYEQLRRRIGTAQMLVPADLDLVARIVREGIAYARQLGFEPHPDYPAAAALLQGAQPDACHVTVPLGKDGKPFFVAGPRDDIPRILAQLTRSVGSENFAYLIPLEMPRPFLDEDEG